MKIPQLLKAKQVTSGMSEGKTYYLNPGTVVLQVCDPFPNGWVTVLYESILLDVDLNRFEKTL